MLNSIWAGFKHEFLEHELATIAHIFSGRPAPREIRFVGTEKTDVCLVYLLGADKPSISEWPEGFSFVARSTLENLSAVVVENLRLFHRNPLEIRLIKLQSDVYEMYVKSR